MPKITALVTLTPDDDPFGTPTETHVVASGRGAAIELDGPGFSLQFDDLDHLDAWLTGVRHDVDSLIARRAAGPALLGGDAA